MMDTEVQTSSFGLPAVLSLEDDNTPDFLAPITSSSAAVPHGYEESTQESECRANPGYGNAIDDIDIVSRTSTSAETSIKPDIEHPEPEYGLGIPKHGNQDMDNEYASFRQGTDCRLSDGSRLQFRRKDRRLIEDASRQETVRIEQKRNIRRQVAGLSGDTDKVLPFGVDIHTLQDNLARRKREAISAEAELAAESRAPVRSPATEVLWTDKYRPSKVADLLCDDRNIRDILKWIKAWDKCVYGTSSRRQRRDGERSRLVGSDTSVHDPMERPMKRILLIHGPAGLGKTTMTSVLASQAGYNTLEINASDDRSGNVVKERVKSVVATRSLSERPSCVILDELDGATGGDGGFINALIEVLNSDTDASRPKNSKAPKRRKRKEPLLLQRPIIGICNDLYGSALRPLRQHAQIISIRPPNTGVMVNRLQRICKGEGFDADIRGLTALCELLGNDWRSCLNSLQMIHRKGDSLTFEVIKKEFTGTKNIEKSPYTVVQSIFSVEDAKKERTGRALQSSGTGASALNVFADQQDDKSRFTKLASLIDGCNEHAKISESCFAHYPSQPYHDDSLSKPVNGCNWLCWYDELETKILKGTHEASSYLTYPMVALHGLFATVETPKIGYTKSFWESREAQQSTNELIGQLHDAMPLTSKRMSHAQSMTLDILPYLIPVISPDLRPVSSQIIKPHERKMLHKVAKTMIMFGLQYRQLKTDEGSLVFRIEPDIDRLMFSNVNQSKLPQRYAVRQIIGETIEALRQKSATASSADDSVSTVQSEPLKRKLKDMVKNQVAPAKKDFFGREIKGEPTDINPDKKGAKKAVSAEKPRKQFVISWHDGYSNAVRKDISFDMVVQRFR